MSSFCYTGWLVKSNNNWCSKRMSDFVEFGHYHGFVACYYSAPVMEQYTHSLELWLTVHGSVTQVLCVIGLSINMPAGRMVFPTQPSASPAPSTCPGMKTVRVQAPQYLCMCLPQHHGRVKVTHTAYNCFKIALQSTHVSCHQHHDNNKSH